MAEETSGAGATPDAGKAESPPQLSVTAQYIKDFSFENPNAPRSLAPPTQQPEIAVTVDVEARSLGEPAFEVTLRIEVTAKQGDSALFVVELVYAGLFTLKNIPEDAMQAVLLVECPRIIFPFARRIVADATRDGGFPPLLIDPIDFAALLRQRQQQSAAQGQDGAPPSAQPVAEA